jgi:hypothetical protein
LDGELQLNLYPPAELTALSKQMIAVWEAANTTETPAVDDENADTGAAEAEEEQEEDEKEVINIFTPEILALVNVYLEEHVTAERLAAMRETLGSWLADPEYKAHELYSYVDTQSRMLALEDAVDNERFFLIMALFGELRPYLLDSDDEGNTEGQAANEPASVPTEAAAEQREEEPQ